MIWLTWRQFRTQAAVIYGAIAALSAVLAATGPRLAHLYRSGRPDFLSNVGGVDTALYLVGSLALLAGPAVIGMFWGAPLVTRELGAGTHQLAWTQTTRTRWLVTKLGLIGLAAMAAAGLLSLAVTWWASPIDKAIGNVTGLPSPGILVFPRFSHEMFDARGIVPLGYAAFFFVLGVTIGVITRRTLPAMAIFLAIFVVAQITMSATVRPHLITPDHLTTTITARDLLNTNAFGSLTVTLDRPGAWIISEQTINASGQAVRPPSWLNHCPPGSGPVAQACFARLDRLGYRQRVSYQPPSRFWAFQRDETAIYLILALLLAGLCTWWVRKRLS